MFNPSDIYTQSNFSNLFGCWTTPVTKFDSSSFYNWEVDNVPVIELEERTELLWERLGHPTSAVDGFSFVVSAEASDQCNSNYFTTLEHCLEKIPEVVNSPYLIEVASYGNLGKINLSNKIFGTNGSIEIINRNFGKSFAIGASGTTSDHVYTNQGLTTSFIASSIAKGSPTDQVPTLGLDFKQAQILSTGQLVASSTTYDSRLNNNLTLFTKNIYPIRENKLTVALAATNSTTPFVNYDSSSVEFDYYENTTVTGVDEFFSTYDANIINRKDGTFIPYGSINSNDNGVVALGYGNKLEGISIHNCNGPIYIRNFTVDGGGYNGEEYGISIKNSTVNLENTSVARCTKAGLYAINSKVILTRSFASYRNYGFDNSGNRIGYDWASKVEYENFNNNQSEYGAGIELVNSELNFKNDYERELQYIKDASSFYEVTGVSSLPAAGWLFCVSRNDIGVKAFNSKITGGFNAVDTEFGSLTDNELLMMNFTCELNTEAGIELVNSTIDYSGRLNLFANFKGIQSENSTIKVNAVTSKYNQKQAIDLNNSNLTYNKDLYLGATTYQNETYKLSKFCFFDNGQHLRLNNSKVEPLYISSMPTNFGRSFFGQVIDIGRNNNTTFQLQPQVYLGNNSQLTLVHPAFDVGDAIADNIDAVEYGTSIKLDSNSRATLQGSKNYPSLFRGYAGSDELAQRYKSCIHATNGSTISIQGPTALWNFGVPLYVENNSTLNISPHKKNEDILVDYFDLTDEANHTIVEIHSLRSCIVANNNSTVSIKDLGSFASNWGDGTYGLAELTKNTDLYDAQAIIQSYCYGGSIQFYPNPNTYLETINPDIYSLQVTGPSGRNYILFDINQNDYDFSSITNGGMCVRALNDSVINLENVNFPCGWWNASSIIYESDSADGLCSRTFIWNIADTSKLNAKYISVSGLHPADVGYYYGPHGVWFSGSNSVAYAAPSSTPDTSSLSLLDYYGLSANHRFAGSSATNYGPFRLYFSVDPAINWAKDLLGANDGYLAQVYSQGYQFSGDLAFPSGIGLYHKQLLNPSGSTSSVASGFYYASAIVSSPETIKALLDDSAANTFANAKHNSVGKSGLAKLVNIYFPYNGDTTDDYGGESALDSIKSRGHGIISINTFDLERNN